MTDLTKPRPVTAQEARRFVSLIAACQEGLGLSVIETCRLIGRIEAQADNLTEEQAEAFRTHFAEKGFAEAIAHIAIGYQVILQEIGRPERN